MSRMFCFLASLLSVFLTYSCRTSSQTKSDIKQGDLKELADRCLRDGGVFAFDKCLDLKPICLNKGGDYRDKQCYAKEDLSQSIVKKIWVFWDKEEKEMPFFYRQNLEHMRKMAGPGWEIHFVNADSKSKNYLGKYLSNEELPPYYFSLDKKITPGTSKPSVVQSDILRLLLLQKYGGFWIDSSIVMNQSLEKSGIFKKLESNPLVEVVGYYVPFLTSERYPNPPFGFDNWFIGARKNSIAIKKWLELFLHYWNTKDPNGSITNHPMYAHEPQVFKENYNHFDYMNQHAALRLMFIKNPELFFSFYVENAEASDDLSKRGDGPLPMLGLYAYSEEGTEDMVFGKPSSAGTKNLYDLVERFKHHTPLIKFPSFTMRRFDPKLKTADGYYGTDNLLRRLWHSSLWHNSVHSHDGFNKKVWLYCSEENCHSKDSVQNNIHHIQSVLDSTWSFVEVHGDSNHKTHQLDVEHEVHKLVQSQKTDDDDHDSLMLKTKYLMSMFALEKDGGVWIDVEKVNLTKDLFESELWNHFQFNGVEIASVSDKSTQDHETKLNADFILSKNHSSVLADWKKEAIHLIKHEHEQHISKSSSKIESIMVKSEDNNKIYIDRTGSFVKSI